MHNDLEETLTRELRAVAGDLHVPPMPSLPEPARRTRPSALLAVAAAVLVVVGLGGVLATILDGDPGPAQPTPSPSVPASPTPSKSSDEPTRPIPTTAPTVPYVIGSGLYVEGEQVPGEWWMVRPSGQAWIAVDKDFLWWWGRGPAPRELPNGEDATPVLSPNGRYVAVVRVSASNASMLTVLDTDDGENVAASPASLGRFTVDDAAHVVAVLDDGRVVVRRGSTDLLWTPGSVNRIVDLSVSAPGQKVLAATAAGLVVTDGETGPPYLADISDEGGLTRHGSLPEHDDLAVSPGGRWLAWTPIGTTGGEVTSLPTLEVQSLDGEGTATLEAPDGWSFKVRTWAWEDDDHLVSTVVSADESRERMARCSPSQARCVLLETGSR